MLVFLPGKGEIDACREACEQAVPRDVNVLPFHAGLHAQSIDRVFANRLNRRVFLAANVTETSLTLSGVRTVIDSGLAHQIEHRGSQNALALMAASQASLDQRAGRAGRTAPDVCVRLFSSSFNPPPSDRPEIERLARHLLGRIPEQAFVLRLRAKRRSGRKKDGLPYANGQVELSVYPWDNGEERSIPDAGLILRAFWSSGRDRGIVGHGSLFLPCDPSWLKPAIGASDVGKVRIDQKNGMLRLMADVPRTLAEVTLSTSEEELSGETFVDTAARLVSEGRILKPAGQILKEQIHLAGIARALRLTREALPHNDAESAAKQLLAELGVQESADMGLIEADDLSLSLADTISVDKNELESLSRDFPVHWVNAGVHHRVIVERSPTPQVILDVERTSFAKAKPPSPSVVRSFRDLPVKWRKGSRTVQVR